MSTRQRHARAVDSFKSAATGTDQEFSSSIEQEDGATHGGSTGVVGQVRTQAPLGTLQNTRSQMELSMWRGEAWHGRAGQAFELAELGVRDGATAKSLPRTATGHKQDDQIVNTKPPAGSCSRVLDQSLGSTRAR